MKVHEVILILVLALGAAAGGEIRAADPGKEKIGTIRTELILGTEKVPASLGKESAALDPKEEERLRRSINIPNYAHYLRMGRDEKPIFRGYENWASPMAGSDALMVSFQPQGRVGTTKLRMDLELWQEKRKVLRTDPVLEHGRRVYILGPKWREGRLIIVVELIDLKPQ